MLLAFDTATPHVTVALHDGASVVATFGSEESMRHGEMLAPGIERVLAEAGATAADLTGIAVGVGPGPFTGLRVGLVTARTLALVREIPVHGVCSLDILAAEAIDAGIEEFVVATDARRKEVYLASYAGGRRVFGPQVLKPEDAATEALVVGRGGSLYPETSRTRPDPSTRPQPYSATSCSGSASRSWRPTRSTCGAPTPPSRGSRSGSAEEQSPPRIAALGDCTPQPTTRTSGRTGRCTSAPGSPQPRRPRRLPRAWGARGSPRPPRRRARPAW